MCGAAAMLCPGWGWEPDSPLALRDFAGSGKVMTFPKGEELRVLIVKLNQGAWSGGIPGT